MDLTPPSLTTSPSSPHRRSVCSPSPYLHCVPEPQTVSYSPLPFFDHSFHIPPPYGSLEHCSATQAMDGNSPLASLEPLSHEGSWGGLGASVSPTMTTTTTIPGSMSSEYDTFTQYDPSCIPSYLNQPSLQRSVSAHVSPAFLRTPPLSSLDVPTRAASIPAKNSFPFVQEPMPMKPRLSSFVNSYGSLPQDAQYSSPRSMGHTYPSSRAHFSAHPHIYVGSQTHAAEPQAMQHLHLAAPSPSPGLVSQETLSTASSGAADTRSKRKRKGIRRHTTKEEAHFQCQVEGCGKFFSRSYNYKSHMETHDDKREYPFPCIMPDCIKKFVRKTDLQRHHQSVHAKERSHKCDFCGRLFARKDTLRRHMEDGCSKRFDIGTLSPSQNYTNNGAHVLQEVGREAATHDLNTPASVRAGSKTLGEGHFEMWSR